MTYGRTVNAGVRLLQAQKQQGTNLCIGLDPHCVAGSLVDSGFYASWPNRSGLFLAFRRVAYAVADERLGRFADCNERLKFVKVVSGVASYMMDVVDIAWEAGIRVFKPQSAFYEQFGQFGQMVLYRVVNHIHHLGESSGEPYFVTLDAKRGDIMTTQLPYYKAYLTSRDCEIVKGLGLLGQFDFDAMTVTTWMGEDVLSPGLPFFQNGRGAIVVTRSSNPSGCLLQEGLIQPNDTVRLTDKQKSFGYTPEMATEFRRRSRELGGPCPTAAELMMLATDQFSETNGLNSLDGISPVFSVIGSTIEEPGMFRRLRPGGIALVPGFGAQGGGFENMMNILATDGPMIGQGAICSSSRGHNFPWMEKYGGSGDPNRLEADLLEVIKVFRQAELEAYEVADIHYPYSRG